MADFLRENCDQIKTIVVKTKGTPTQKLLAILIACGIESSTELAELIGVLPRAVRKAKAELQDLGPTVPSGPTVPHARSYSSAIGPVVPPSPARVEDNNIITNLETPVAKESKILLRADAPKPKKQVQGTRLNPNWELSEDLRQWTRTRFPQTTDQRLADELETFRDYWIAVPGQRGRKLDWDATWRTWSKRAFATAPIRPRAADGERPVSSWEAEKAAKHARIRALMESVGGSA